MSELSAGYEDTRETGSRDSVGEGSTAGVRRRPASSGHASSSLVHALGHGEARIWAGGRDFVAPPSRPPIGQARASPSQRLPIGARVWTPRPIELQLCTAAGGLFPVVATTSPASEPAFSGMSRRVCSGLPRPSSCPCSLGARTVADGCKEESPIHSVKMKCFNCNPDLSELEVVRPEDSERQGSYSPECLEPSCKDCFRNHEGFSFIDSPIVGHDNKENQRVQKLLNSSNEAEELESSRLYEDSGYSSFTHQSEHEDGILILQNFRNSTQPRLLPSQSPDQYPNKNLLPALHFERVVCSTLKKNCKRNPKVDREMLKEVIASGNFRLQNIIGKKMGLEHLDILTELSRRGFKHLVANILTKLSDVDLINLSNVSRIWKKIVENDKRASQLYSKAMQRVLESSKLSLHASTRGYVVSRTALTSIQKSSPWTPPKKDAQTKFPSQHDQKGSAYSRHSEFLEMAKTLKNNESLKACIRCTFPAKYDHYLERATCKRESCGFDYCTKCLCDYHNNTKDCSKGKLPKASCKFPDVYGELKCCLPFLLPRNQEKCLDVDFHYWKCLHCVFK
ncbi:F-box only protein 5 [Sigmodon hispidus]